MTFSLEEYLQCPDCKGELTLGPEMAGCQGCGRKFIREDGIYLLMPQQELPTPKFYDDPEYCRYLEKIDILHEAHYRAGSLTGRIEEAFKQKLAELILDREPPLLDLGCGTGYGFRYLGPEEYIIGVDNNFTLLQKCQRLFPKATLICCDMRRSPFRPNCFRTLSSIGTLEHVFHLEAFVESAERCLAPEGRFYVLIPTEGGILWNLGRTLWAAPRNSSLLGLDWGRVIAKDNCNKVHTIHNVLQKFFEIEVQRQYPLRFGGFNLNLAVLYRLKKRI